MLAETLLGIFMFLIGFGMLYLGFRRDAVMWHILAAIIFIVSVMYGMSIPFVVDASGAVMGGAGNVMFSGVSLIFFVIALIFSVEKAFGFFKT